MVLRSEFELFEVLPDGASASHGTVNTVEDAWRRLREMARYTDHECFALHVATQRVIGHLNDRVANRRETKHILQITYAHEMALAREEILRQWGYRVTTVIGNEMARALLLTAVHFDLFIIGHAAPEPTRNDMVDWLREKFPDVKIVSLNPFHQALRRADFNVQINGPESWLPAVARAMA